VVAQVQGRVVASRALVAFDCREYRDRERFVAIKGRYNNRDLHFYIYRFTERDGRKGPPAENKVRCNRTNTPHSMATQRKAKPNQTPTTQPTDGARDRPRQPQPRAERDHASGSEHKHAS
jgi:hypothetical protein